VTVNVGVIGAGMIGQDHIRRLTDVLSGARVTAVTDVDLDRAKSAVERLPGVQVHETGQDLISDPGVDAVIVASWGPTHEEYVLAGIAAGKQPQSHASVSLGWLSGCTGAVGRGGRCSRGRQRYPDGGRSQ
jgi:myo-inositol 2-dehydrogenase / D-chiro-inositol 1-dehydrogenase